MIAGFSQDDLFVHPDVKQAQVLPLGVYWDPEILLHEWYTIFPKMWSPLPKNTVSDKDWKELEISGHRVPFTFYKRSYFFVRDFLPAGKPALNCFLNNCPHLGYPLVKEAETKQENIVQCDQHGLTTDCSGKFRLHPAFERNSQRAKECLSLKAIPLKQFPYLDLLFLARAEPLASFEEVFDPMLESVSLLPLREFGYVPNQEEERILTGNWKLHGANYLDRLHVRYLHKEPGGLEGAIYMDSYKTKLFPYSVLQWAHAKDPRAGFDWQYLSKEKFGDSRNPERKVFAIWWLIFPNMTFNFYPWGLAVNIYMPIAGDPLHIRFIWYHYVWKPELYALRDDLWLSYRVDREDIDIVEKQQEIAQPWGPKFERGTFGEREELERGPHWFQRKWYETAVLSHSQ